MNRGVYRSSAEEFLRETEWALPSAMARLRLEIALRYFCTHVPAAQLDLPGDPPNTHEGERYAFRPSHGRWTKLMGWMQSIDFDHPVNPQFAVLAGNRLTAFRDKPETGRSHRFGNFYVLGEGSGPRGLGIPTTQSTPVRYVARRTILALETVVADAFLSWIDPEAYPSSFARGGRKQLFIWQAELVLEPLVSTVDRQHPSDG